MRRTAAPLAAGVGTQDPQGHRHGLEGTEADHVEHAGPGPRLIEGADD